MFQKTKHKSIPQNGCTHKQKNPEETKPNMHNQPRIDGYSKFYKPSLSTNLNSECPK